jgi:hypothetical protein
LNDWKWLKQQSYYGESQPFPDVESLSGDEYQFLTFNQSLVDLPFFAANFSFDAYPAVDVRPAATPWIMVGCSYSGTRAAWSRAKYPETFFAAFAESTVVQAEVEVEGFGTELHRSLVDHGYDDCSKDLHSLLEYVDSQLDHVASSASIKEQYLGPGAASTSNKDFAGAILSLFMYFKGWGIEDGKPSVIALCDHLQYTSTISTTRPEAASADLHDPRSLSGRLASWPEFLAHVNKIYNTSCNLTSPSTSNNCSLSEGTIFDDPHDHGWLWQQCTELGLFVAQEHSTTSLTSKYVSLEMQGHFRHGLAHPPSRYHSGSRTDQSAIRRKRRASFKRVLDHRRIRYVSGLLAIEQVRSGGRFRACCDIAGNIRL